jgi:hypothetical protein
MKLDPWQIEVENTTGNLALCAGRQVGKSTIISMKAGRSACTHDNRSILIVASVERQALLLFEKVLSWIHDNYKWLIKTGKEKPTKHELRLKNGSIIRCLPTGMSGYGIRGYTIDELYADEAAFIPEAVWSAITPMLATTGGTINLLSTPFGAKGYFYRAFHDKKNFTSIHVNTEEVAMGREEPQRTRMLEFLKQEKLSMPKLQYQQEYQGLFVGGIMRFFPDDLLMKCCTINPRLTKPSIYNNFLGVDVARMGGDETVLISVERIKRDRIRMFEMNIPEQQRLTDTTRLIIHQNKKHNYKKIYVDDGGLGAGVFDMLFEHPETKRRVVGINNASKVIEKKKGKMNSDKKKRILKEELYQNLLTLMEQGKAELFDMPEVIQSLRSIQYEYSDAGKLLIYGNYSHITESLIRAAWCMKDKTLNIRSYC